jgi:isopentenyl-diphosphate delta-isomerase
VNDGNDLTIRKKDHVEIVLGDAGVRSTVGTGLGRIRFEHVALPEMSLDDVVLGTTFLGKSLDSPFLISSMTGGFAKGSRINHHLAEAAAHRRIALAVGSQRIALEDEASGSAGFGKELRKLAPKIPIYANLGAAQFAKGYGLPDARRAIDMLEADALIIHLNPLQEAVQSGGDRNWSFLLDTLGKLANELDVPVIVKEVGFGISGALAKKLAKRGIAAIDVAGAGGTNWAMVEAQRSKASDLRKVAEAFADRGIPTAYAIHGVRSALPHIPLIGSGGIRTGVEAAKAIRLGADLVGIAAGLLEAATKSAKAVDDELGIVIDQLRITCFCTGSRNLRELKAAPLVNEMT